MQFFPTHSRVERDKHTAAIVQPMGHEIQMPVVPSMNFFMSPRAESELERMLLTAGAQDA